MAGGRWTTEAAGLPCTIEAARDGSWIVTIAEATVSRRDDLATAIVEAAGGLVGEEEAAALAARVVDGYAATLGRS